MKKLSKIFIAFIGLFPIMLNASETREEVKYRFYENLEDNVHYELYPEQVCSGSELIDYDNFVYTDYMISNEKPDDKLNRVIESFDGPLNINVDYVNYLYIGNFDNILGSTSDMRRLQLFDGSGEEISYIIYDYRNFGAYPHVGGYTNEYPGSLNDDDISETVLTNANSSMRLKLDRTVYLKDLVIKVTYKDVGDGFSGLTYFGQIDYYFSSMMPSMYSEKATICDEDNMCEMTITNPDYPGSEPVTIDTKMFKYKDAMYKCYTPKRNYVPGYYSDLEGFIKDEDKFKVELITDYSDERDEIFSLINDVQNENNSIKLSLTKVNNLAHDIIDKIDNINLDNQNIIDRLSSVYTENETIKEVISKVISSNQDIAKYIDLIMNNTLTKDEFNQYVSLLNTSNQEILNALSSLDEEENTSEIREYIDSLYVNNSELINSLEEPIDEETEDVNEDLIAMKEVNVKELKYDTLSMFLIVFGVLSLILSLLLYIKSVKKGRTK